MADKTQTREQLTRIDPAPRPVNGGGAGLAGRLSGRDPNKHYVYVNTRDEAAMEDYGAAGYVPTHYGESGAPKPVWRTGKDGDPVEVTGHLLMSVSKERKEELRNFGPDGRTGWQLTQRIQDQISGGDRGLPEEARKASSRHFSFSNTTQPLTTARQ